MGKITATLISLLVCIGCSNEFQAAKSSPRSTSSTNTLDNDSSTPEVSDETASPAQGTSGDTTNQNPDSNPTIPPNPTSPSDPVSPPPTSQHLVTVGVGVGGRIVSGINGFEQIIFEEEVFSPAEQNSIRTDPNDSSKLICPSGWKQIGTRCCLSQNNCIGGGWHSDFLYRGVAYGNGRFVAVGGWGHAITRTSTDGVNWGPKNNLTAGSNLVTGAKDNARWMAGVAFGQGRFVAVDGYSGSMIWSTDGTHWVDTGSKPSTRHGTFRRVYFVGGQFYGKGDNNAWAFSDDGLTWKASGGGAGAIAPEELYSDGTWTYGFQGDNIYRLRDGTTQWQLYYQHTGSIGTFALNWVTDTFFLFTGNSSTWTQTPVQPSSWQKVSAKAPGRWSHFTGTHFVGKRTGWSADGKNWQTTPSPINATSEILYYSSGMVDRSP